MAPRKTPSVVWKSFDKISPNTVECKICSSKLAFSGSTGTMLNHLKLKHPSSSCDSASNSQTSIRSYTKDAFIPPARATRVTSLIAELIANDSLPIALVESVSFRNLMKYLEPGYKVPSRPTMTSYIEHIYEDKKKQLLAQLAEAECVSLTTDCWTAINQEGYMTVTCHYLKDFRLESAVLDTSPVAQLQDEDDDAQEEDGEPVAAQPQARGPQRHTAEALAAQLKAVAIEWKVNDKVTAVVHDNASNVKKIGELSVGAKDIGCAAHTLQLCVKKGIDTPKISRLVGAANRLVGHFKHSTIATKALESKQDEMKRPKLRLISSCKTRWNSTYEMMERLLVCRWPVCSVLSDPDYTTRADARTLELEDDQWRLMTDLMPCLKPLQVATTLLSAEYTVTLSNTQPSVRGLLRHMAILEATPEHAEDSRPIRVFKETVAAELQRRFCDGNSTSLSMKACVVDPRFKSLKFIVEGEREATYAAVQSEMKLVHDEAQVPEAADVDADELPAKEPKLSGLDFLMGSTPEEAPDAEDTHMVEFEYYMRLPDLNNNSDPMEWWLRHCKTFPILSKIAHKYLSIPCTSVPSERVFSAAGNIVNKKRSCLTSEHVNMLIFLNKNK